jgi:hypothetical protein
MIDGPEQDALNRDYQRHLQQVLDYRMGKFAADIDPTTTAQAASDILMAVVADYTEIIAALKLRADYLRHKGHVQSPLELIRLRNVLKTHLEKLMTLDDKIIALANHDTRINQELVDLKANPKPPEGKVLINQTTADVINGIVADDNTIKDPAPTPAA